jgi:GNAT superfamily N-acetyltransferase
VTTRHTSHEQGGSIRAAEEADVPAILRLVHELAAYEREPEAVEATDAHFRAALFPPDHAPTAFAHVAVVDGTVVGMALWFVTFSTWLGRSGIWLEDLFVSPAHRGSGLGRQLLATLAQLCAERSYGRLEWWVLRWNTPSIGFYDSLGGQPMDDWLTYRLDGPELDALARVGPAASPQGASAPASD